METPKNAAGEITEKIMARVKEKIPDISVDQYNKIYSSVYEGLSNVTYISRQN